MNPPPAISPDVYARPFRKDRPTLRDWPIAAAELLARRPELLGVGVTGALEAVVSC
ncbi:hypothetical protein [Nocardioides sp. YIM 152315]|uniref:hypothetical protein n=1 Tax=Nocardioides sp. YIM 152315 TaxID=3031760 RepID=UPI0023DCE8D4|nr:hypothetical protein [Nocardioides sp. YIM 152315]MDF1603370.1 hypothetical protein [Nocardioides sp. YIM 152315]